MEVMEVDETEAEVTVERHLPTALLADARLQSITSRWSTMVTTMWPTCAA